jgi:DNA/RNA endonuclease YhcR with UshA esterase domain
MQEKNLMILSAILFAFGLFYLSFSYFLSSPQIVSSLSSSLIDKKVIFTGQIIDKRVTQAGMLLVMQGQTKVFFFENTVEDLKKKGINPVLFQIGQNITVSGKVQEYWGQLEIVVSDVSYA